jgi:hypothetical protein
VVRESLCASPRVRELRGGHRKTTVPHTRVAKANNTLKGDKQRSPTISHGRDEYVHPTQTTHPIHRHHHQPHATNLNRWAVSSASTVDLAQNLAVSLTKTSTGAGVGSPVLCCFLPTSFVSTGCISWMIEIGGWAYPRVSHFSRLLSMIFGLFGCCLLFSL